MGTIINESAAAQADVYRAYEKALETLCCRALGEPYNMHLIEHQVAPAMLTGAHGAVFAECLKQFREYREYSPQSIAAETGRDKGLLVTWAGMDSESDLPTAFVTFTRTYERWVELQIADSVRQWVREGKGSLEIRQAADKRRRDLGVIDARVVSDGRDEFEKRLKAALDGVITQYPVEPPLNDIRLGVPFWQPSDYIVIAGRTGMGKSYMGLNAIYHNAKRGIPAVYINLENAPPDVQKRLWQFETGERFQVWKGATNEEIRRRVEAWESVKKLPITVEKPGNSLAAITNAIRRAHYEQGIHLAVVDYVQQVRTGGRDRVGEIEQVSADLRALALELDICVLAIAQLSRQAEARPDKRPQLSDLKGSGGLEQDATGVYLIFRPAYYNILTDENGMPYPDGHADILIAKGRESGPGLISATFDPVRGFTDAPKGATPQPTAPAPLDYTIPAAARPRIDEDIPF